MLRPLRLALLQTGQTFGFARLLMRSAWRRTRLLILCYHGVSLCDEHLWNPGLYLTRRDLQRRLQRIAESGCTVLGLAEALRRLYAGDLPPKAIVLTFDDGTYDFYREAFPLVERFGFPVTVYLTTYYANFNRPVFDTMSSYLLWKARGQSLEFPQIFDKPVRLSGRMIERASAQLRQYARERCLSGAEKDHILGQAAERLHLDYGQILQKRLLHIMKISEAEELARRGVDFQLHTHTHRHWIPANEHLFQREISENRRYLERLRSTAAAHLAYPDGLHQPGCFDSLREANIASAVTCVPGLATRWSDPLLLPRFVDGSNVTESEFVGWLSGLAEFVTRRARFRGLHEHAGIIPNAQNRAGEMTAAAPAENILKE